MQGSFKSMKKSFPFPFGYGSDGNFGISITRNVSKNDRNRNRSYGSQSLSKLSNIRSFNVGDFVEIQNFNEFRLGIIVRLPASSNKIPISIQIPIKLQYIQGRIR
jgi:hypothetical protein